MSKASSLSSQNRELRKRVRELTNDNDTSSSSSSSDSSKSMKGKKKKLTAGNDTSSSSSSSDSSKSMKGKKKKVSAGTARKHQKKANIIFTISPSQSGSISSGSTIDVNELKKSNQMNAAQKTLMAKISEACRETEQSEMTKKEKKSSQSSQSKELESFGDSSDSTSESSEVSAKGKENADKKKRNSSKARKTTMVEAKSKSASKASRKSGKRSTLAKRMTMTKAKVKKKSASKASSGDLSESLTLLSKMDDDERIKELLKRQSEKAIASRKSGKRESTSARRTTMATVKSRTASKVSGGNLNISEPLKLSSKPELYETLESPKMDKTLKIIVEASEEQSEKVIPSRKSGKKVSVSIKLSHEIASDSKAKRKSKSSRKSGKKKSDSKARRTTMATAKSRTASKVSSIHISESLKSSSEIESSETWESPKMDETLENIEAVSEEQNEKANASIKSASPRLSEPKTVYEMTNSIDQSSRFTQFMKGTSQKEKGKKKRSTVRIPSMRLSKAIKKKRSSHHFSKAISLTRIKEKSMTPITTYKERSSLMLRFPLRRVNMHGKGYRKTKSQWEIVETVPKPFKNLYFGYVKPNAPKSKISEAEQVHEEIIELLMMDSCTFERAFRYKKVVSAPIIRTSKTYKYRYYL